MSPSIPLARTRAHAAVGEVPAGPALGAHGGAIAKFW
jgi:hypothetical protein